MEILYVTLAALVAYAVGLYTGGRRKGDTPAAAAARTELALEKSRRVEDIGDRDRVIEYLKAHADRLAAELSNSRAFAADVLDRFVPKKGDEATPERAFHPFPPLKPRTPEEILAQPVAGKRMMAYRERMADEAREAQEAEKRANKPPLTLEEMAEVEDAFRRQ
jgi:hypothetical protein